MNLPLTRLIVVTLTLLIAAVPAAAQNFKIFKIEFEGLSRVSADEMIATTGLKVGDTFSLASLDDAAQRLVDSGLFKHVAYRTRPNKDQITIVFQVEEARVASSRVIFDNFIWFTDVELIAAVKRELPSFDGTAPDSGNTVDRVIKALQRFLHEHRIEATVSHITSQDDPDSPVQEHVFTVNGVPLPICTISFPGAQNISEAKLRENSRQLSNSEYSRKFVSLFVETNLIPLYREVGQLKAAFSPPLAKPEATARCKSGVELTIPVDEGHIYNWAGAVWTGNASLTTPELDSLLGMPSGQPANGVKLDHASDDIQKAYGKKGFLLVTVKSVPEFDDQAQSVKYKMDVDEGPQFRMGNLITTGFSESETAKIKTKWALKTGEIFDLGYVEEFGRKTLFEIIRDTLRQRVSQGKPAPNVKWGFKPDRKTLTADVTLALAN